MVVKTITPTALKKQIDDYFKNLPSSVFPDEAGMLLELGLFPDEVSELCDEDQNRKAGEFRRVFQYAELKRESWLARVAASDSKLASGAFNLLKQGKNGGYTSVSNKEKNSTLLRVVDGVGGADAFK